MALARVKNCLRFRFISIVLLEFSDDKTEEVLHPEPRCQDFFSPWTISQAYGSA
jgi:hypothetical protein